ncbi:MarR family transcriptional regulator [Phenylobacterium hankyongense]|uniref:MarR family transcriptional regulator n=1 Tax=Phenylobacterium hankyongense TaxID=1813876 RepID=A0A328AXB8_9CAUL|nr:MarR family winged helix-turn-helix transcriptional regulator [Phenylobacterium hankyongense]RAK59299.1 MarR family transcriptional regulator [Phenylobacterium hankyongense]
MAKGKSGTKGGVVALERSPSHLLHRTLQLALDIYAEEFGPGAITQRQYAVLAATADHEDSTQTDLVRITGIDRSTLADMAARMIAKGLLERRRSDVDARANAVRLTDQGREVLEAARPKMAAADARLLKLISGGGRRETFVGLLKDLIRAADAAAAQPPAEPAGKHTKPAKPAKAAKLESKKKKKPKKAA